MKKFTAALSGTVIEYYDYALYGFAAVHLAQNFFPPSDSITALLASFLVFALGSFAKPAGAFVFGSIGDFKGRTVALRWSMLGIALPTCIIGLLPTYSDWGALSTLILVLCRFFQGFFLSGEYDGVAIYIQEHISNKYACLGNCLLGMCSFLGIYFASFIISLSNDLFAYPWSWRLPFLLGGLLGILSYISRRYLIEPNVYQSEKHPPLSVTDLIKTQWIVFLGAILLCGAAGAIYQFTFIFWPTYLQNVIGVWNNQHSFITSHGLMILILCCPIAGYIADRFGAEKAFLYGTSFVLFGLLLTLIFSIFGIYSDILYKLQVLSLPFFMSTGHVLLTRFVSIKERYRIINIGHAFGSMLFSGSTPAIALLIWQKTQVANLPLLYALSFPFLSLLGLSLLKGRSSHKFSAIITSKGMKLRNSYRWLRDTGISDNVKHRPHKHV